MPSELIRAILDGNEALVRALARTRHELLGTRSDTGTLPVDLAIAAGRSVIATILLRCGGAGDRAPDHGQLLLDCMGELSEAWFCAGWLDGIEVRLWRFMKTGESPFHAYEALTDPEPGVRDDLRYLVDRAQIWYACVDGTVQKVPLLDWETRVREAPPTV
jgi:hypothetical protein